MIKKLIMTLVILVVIAAVVGLFLPAQTHVDRSIVINKAPSAVFPWVNSLKKFSEWSPWADLDPNMQITFSGPDEGTGAAMQWSSDEASVGSGSQEIIESVADTTVVTKLDFGSSAPTTGTWDLAADGESATSIKWSLDVEHGYNLLSRYFGLMLDTWVGSMYETGLKTLKQKVET